MIIASVARLRFPMVMVYRRRLSSFESYGLTPSTKQPSQSLRLPTLNQLIRYGRKRLKTSRHNGSCGGFDSPNVTTLSTYCRDGDVVWGSAGRDVLLLRRLTMSNDTNAQPENAQEPQQETQQEQPQDEPKDVLGDAGKKALDAERKRANEAEKRFKEAAARIEEFENAQRTEEEKREHELQTLRAQIEEERKQREAVERDLLIKSVASEFGLPDELANRLVG